MFATSDFRREHERLRKLGFEFRTPPTAPGPVKVALGRYLRNIIQIVQQ
jgi:hypothetical protein